MAVFLALINGVPLTTALLLWFGPEHCTSAWYWMRTSHIFNYFVEWALEDEASASGSLFLVLVTSTEGDKFIVLNRFLRMQSQYPGRPWKKILRLARGADLDERVDRMDLDCAKIDESLEEQLSDRDEEP
jgi:hypothetical protein